MYELVVLKVCVELFVHIKKKKKKKVRSLSESLDN